MFNEKQKMRYINETEHLYSKPDVYRKKVEQLFANIEGAESENGKDIACFTFEELKKAMPVIFRKGVSSQVVILSGIRRYLEWCIAHYGTVDCLDQENRLAGVGVSDFDTTDSYRMTMLKDEAQLTEYMNIMFSQEKRTPSEDLKRACWYLMYNGAEPRDAFYIKLEQINFSKKTMEYREKTYDLSDKCLEAINYLHSPAYRFDLHRDIAGAEYALVNSATDREKMFISVKTAASAYFRRLKETMGHPVPISQTSIFISGVFYRAYQREKETGIVNLSEFKRFNGEPYACHYETWKKAFGLE